MIIISNCVAEATLFLPFDKVTANLIRISFLLAVLNFHKLENMQGKIGQKKYLKSYSASLFLALCIFERQLLLGPLPRILHML